MHSSKKASKEKKHRDKKKNDQSNSRTLAPSSNLFTSPAEHSQTGTLAPSLNLLHSPDDQSETGTLNMSSSNLLDSPGTLLQSNTSIQDNSPSQQLPTDQIAGYVHQVSDIRTPKSGNVYFDFNLQMSPTKVTYTSSPELMPSRPSLKRERSLSPSTLSVDSEDQLSDSSFSFDTPRPQASKSAKCSKGIMMTKWDDFSFPIPPGLKKDADEIADTIRKQVIRDVYTCMRAKCGDEKISSNDFITVAKKVCKRIPQLKDKKGVGLKVDSGDFAYWGTVLYLLRKRHSNLKRPAGGEDAKEGKRKSKKGKGQAALDEASPEDIAKHEKQLMIELRKKTVNHEAVKQLQRLSFATRVQDIVNNFQGSDVVKKVCEKYPFLQLEQQILWELQLHISKISGEEAPCIKDFEDNWQRLLPYLCEQETPKDEMSGSAVKRISSFFIDCPSVVIAIDQTSGDVDEVVKREVKSSSVRLLTFEPGDNDTASSSAKDLGQLFLVVDKAIFLEIEGHEAGIIDYSKGLLLLLAMYYSFNLEYDANQKLLYQFLEEHVLGLKPLRRTFKYRQICNKIFGQPKNTEEK